MAYLGFTLTPDGITPGEEKLKLIKEQQAPTNLKQVRAFVGLCNFFRNHIRNFALLSAPLTQLCRQDSGYQQGPLPPSAAKAFKVLQNTLATGPVLAFPRVNRDYVLITEAHPPTDAQEGCVSATLCQKDDQHRYHVLAHGSRQLQRHENRYPPFLLGVLAAVYGMDAFDEHLRGRPFLLLMDEHPLTELGHLHKKTLARFQASMDEYQFIVQQKSSAGLPAELKTTSTWAVNTFGPNLSNLRQEQHTDPDILHCLHFRQHGQWPTELTANEVHRLKAFNDCLFSDHQDTLWLRCGPDTALFVPAPLRPAILCQLIRANPGSKDPKSLSDQLIKASYAWPGCRQQIQEHLSTCQICQSSPTRTPSPVTPNEQVTLEVCGPLPSYDDNKFLIIIRDRATGYTEFAPSPSRTPADLAGVLIRKWISKLMVPLSLTTNLDQEANHRLRQEVELRLGDLGRRLLMNTTDAPMVPDSLMQHVRRLIRSTDLSWTAFIPALTFVYNTTYRTCIQNVPYKLLHGFEPTVINSVPQSYSDEPIPRELNFYAKALQFLQDTAAVPALSDSEFSGQKWALGSSVFMWENSFGQKSWSGPYKVIGIKNNRVRLQISPSKARWFSEDRVALTPGTSLQGEVPQINRVQNIPEHTWNQATDLATPLAVIKTQLDKLQALQMMPKPPADAQTVVINAATPSINAPINEVADYLRRLTPKIYNSPSLDSHLCTSEELNYWLSFEPSYRNLLITGDPLHPPEWRSQLVEFADPEDRPRRSIPLPDLPQPAAAPAGPVPVRLHHWTSRPTQDLNNNPVPQPSSKPPKTLYREFKSRVSKGIRQSFGKAGRKLEPTSRFYQPLPEGPLGSFPQ